MVRGFSACATALRLALPTLGLLSAAQAHAEEASPTLLAYRAPEGCPLVPDFERSVQRRSARVRFVDAGPHERELSIAVRNEREATYGELRLVERDGRESQRHVRFTTCAEAVEGLALIAVVSLDPQALLGLEKPTAEESPSTQAPAPNAAPKPTPPPTNGATHAAKSAPEQSSLAQDSSTPSHPSGSGVALGATFTVAPKALPELALGGSLFGDFAWSSMSWFAPMLRLAFSHIERRGLASSDGSEANFTLTLGTLSVCPCRLAAGILELRPCGFGSGGALYAWGSQTTNLQQRTRPYGALGGSLLLAARASEGIDLIADLAVGASLLRDSFGFEQDQPWRTPSLYLSSGIGARFRFR